MSSLAIRGERQHRATTVKHYRGVLHRLGTWFRACAEDKDEERQRWAEIAIDVVDEKGGAKFSVDVRRLHAAEMEPFFAFVRAQTELTGDDGEQLPVKVATISGYRAAVHFAFQEAGLASLWTDELAARMHQEFQRVRALALASPGAGQPAMTEEMARAVSAAWLASGKRKHRFARTFLLLQWNTCSSSSQTASLDLQHMTWEGDSLLLHIRKKRADQPMLRSRIYCNPKDPVMCPVLALALHLADWDSGDTAVFPGSGQDSRFSNILREFVRNGTGLPDGTSLQNPRTLRNGAALLACGMDSADAGAARTATERFQKNQKRGDGSLARRLAGLKPSDAEYGQAPPTLGVSGSLCYTLLVPNFSSRLLGTASLLPVLRACLAQLVHHRAALGRFLSAAHPATALPLFTDASVCARLQEVLVVPGQARGSGTRTPEEAAAAAAAAEAAAAATRALNGSEFNVAAARIFEADRQEQQRQEDANQALAQELAASMPEAVEMSLGPMFSSFAEKARDLRAEQRRLRESLTSALAQPLMQKVNEHLEGSNSAPLPQSALTGIVQSAISQVLDSHVSEALSSPASPFLPPSAALALAEPIRPPSAQQETIPPPVATQPQQPLLDGEATLTTEEGRFFCHSPNRYLRVPVGFKLPKAVVQEAWMLWFVGDPTTGVMAFRRFRREDLARNKPLQGSYSEWRKVLGSAERYLRLEGALVENPTRQQAADMYTAALPFLDYLTARGHRDGATRQRHKPATILALAHRLRVLSDADIATARDEIRAAAAAASAQ